MRATRAAFPEPAYGPGSTQEAKELLSRQQHATKASEDAYHAAKARGADDAEADRAYSLAYASAMAAANVPGGASVDPTEQDAPTALLRGARPAPFPLYVLPPTAERFARDASKALPAPVDFLGVPQIVAAAAAVGLSREVALSTSHRERPVLFAAIVAAPGHMKTPALSMVMEPIRALEDQAHAVWKEKRALAEASGQPLPAREHFMLSDVTLEALVEVLDRQPRGVIVYRDELAGWVRGMDQYRAKGKGSDLQAWLEIYSGQSFKVQRVRREAQYVSRPFVCVLGSIQPAVLGDLSTGREEGFVDRLLFAYPDAQPFQFSRDEVSPAARTGWTELIQRLYALELGEGRTPIALQLTPDATEAFYDWHAALYRQAREADLPDHVRNFYQKAKGLALRLSLVIQLLWWADGRRTGEHVEPQSVADATELVAYFIDHWTRTREQMLSTSAERGVVALRDWMLRRGLRRATTREAQKANVAGCRTADEVRTLFAAAQRYGLGVYGPTKGDSGHTVDVFELVDHG